MLKRFGKKQTPPLRVLLSPGTLTRLVPRGATKEATATIRKTSQSSVRPFRPQPCAVKPSRPERASKKKSSHRGIESGGAPSGLIRRQVSNLLACSLWAGESPRSLRWCQRRCCRDIWTRDPDVRAADATALSIRETVRGLWSVGPLRWAVSARSSLQATKDFIRFVPPSQAVRRASPRCSQEHLHPGNAGL